MNLSYSHLVEFDEKERKLLIFRLFEDGSRGFYSELEMPEASFNDDADEIKKFAQILGENLLADSPIARKLFSI